MLSTLDPQPHAFVIAIESLGDQNQLFHQMLHALAANKETARRKLNGFGQSDDSGLMDLLLECGSCCDQRAPGAGTQFLDARPDLYAALAFPAPIGVSLQFAQTRHQFAAADGKRVAVTLGAEAAQRFVRGAPAQIK